MSRVLGAAVWLWATVAAADLEAAVSPAAPQTVRLSSTVVAVPVLNPAGALQLEAWGRLSHVALRGRLTGSLVGNLPDGHLAGARGTSWILGAEATLSLAFEHFEIGLGLGGFGYQSRLPSCELPDATHEDECSIESGNLVVGTLRIGRWEGRHLHLVALIPPYPYVAGNPLAWLFRIEAGLPLRGDFQLSARASREIGIASLTVGLTRTFQRSHGSWAITVRGGVAFVLQAAPVVEVALGWGR